MKEYFIELQGDNKEHSFRVEANYTPGASYVSNPTNEEDFLYPGDPDEVEIINVFVENENGKDRLIDPIPDYLMRALEEKILEEERYGV